MAGGYPTGSVELENISIIGVLLHSIGKHYMPHTWICDRNFFPFTGGFGRKETACLSKESYRISREIVEISPAP